MKTIAVTGATGFVGRRLLVCNNHKYRQQIIDLRNVSANTGMQEVQAIVHLAGKAHQLQPVPDKLYFDVNYELTRQLADAAKANGVKQFVYISSTKVYGDDGHETFNESSPCTPSDAYGASKLKAEQYLQSIETPFFKVAIVRPPLVYGPGVKGNMIRLLQMAAGNLPLPLGKINNARSMVYVDNLVALINAIIDKEASGIFIAGDDMPVSTSKLLLLITTFLGSNKRLISLPAPARQAIRMVKPALYLRLFGSFVVDNTNTNQRLGFTPPHTTAHGVEQMVKWFKESDKSRRRSGGE